MRIGDTITGEVEVRSARVDKPIVELGLRVTRQNGVRVLGAAHRGRAGVDVVVQV